MARTLIGGIVAGLIIFVLGYIFWATPLGDIPYKTAGDAQNAAAERAREIGLQHDRNRHRNPVRSLQRDRPANRVADRETNCKPECVPENRGIKREIRPQLREAPRKLQIPRLRSGSGQT